MALTATRAGDVVTVTLFGPGFVLLDDHYIDQVEWDNPTTAAHRFVIADGNDGNFLQGRVNAQTIGQLINFDVKRVCLKGLKVPTLDSGTLTIYLAKKPR
ncbi:MAG: hypothetical protein Q7U76_12920 [Nitrospirota bacterium]|nr:hypothetical protein [Nitrospirota bacterium]